jgi:hypothetical protein
VPDRTLRLALAAVLLSSGGGAAEGPARPRLCAQDLPEGAHLPPQPGCDGRTVPAASREKNGFRDLGEGVSVRIGGRAGAEFGARR